MQTPKAMVRKDVKLIEDARAAQQHSACGSVPKRTSRLNLCEGPGLLSVAELIVRVTLQYVSHLIHGSRRTGPRISL